MPTLSVCMIVRDEEEHLASCLRSIEGLHDELIVVDTGSIDRTKEVARSFGARVFDFTWADDFSAARNFSLEKATKEWIMVIDADEQLEPPDVAAVRQLISMPDLDAFTLVQRTYTNDVNNISFIPFARPIKGFFGYLPVEVVRLLKRNHAYRYAGRVHELLDASLIAAGARVGFSDAALHHYSHLKGPDKVREKQLYYLALSRKELEIRPEDEKLLCDIGLLTFYFEGQRDAGLGYLNRALLFHPKSARAHQLLGQLLASSKMFEKAIQHYETALTLSPDDVAPLHFNLGELYSLLGETGKAKQHYMSAIEHNHVHSQAIKQKLMRL